MELLRKFRPGEIIASEEERKEFVRLFGALLRVLNILQAFDQFAGHELLSERDMQDYLGMYNDKAKRSRQREDQGRPRL